MTVDLSVKTDFNKGACLNQIGRTIDKATAGTARRFKALADPYVPWLTGTTARSAGLSDFDKGEITYDTPYAHHIYYADPDRVTLTKDKHPNAIVRWGDFVMNKYKKELETTFQRLLDSEV